MRIRTSTPRRSTRAVVAAVVLSVMSGLLLPFASVAAAQALPGPETISSTSVAWRVTDASGALVGGATFELQGPRTSTVWGNMEWNVSWNTVVTVTDCSAAPCAGPDVDPDAGEFQVANIGSHRVETGARYRLRQTASPAGYESPSTAWSEMGSNAQWQSRVYSFSAFQVAALPEVSCASNRLYATSANGTVSAIAVNGGAASLSTFGQWPGVDDVNALGASADGTLYALQRASATSVQSVLRYTSTTGWQSIAAAYSAGSSLIAGAVSPLNGRFYFGGGFLEGSVYNFRLHQFDPATGAVSRVGIITTSLTAEQNADIAFDAAGNLVVFHSPLNGSTTVSRFDVAASAVSAGTGTTRLASVRTTIASVAANVNGVAFDSDGSVYFGTETQLRRVDAAGGTPTTIGQLPSSVDLASCAAPVTITVQKAVPARVAATDQFALSIRQGTSGTVLGTATTTGTATGVQAARISDITVPTSETVTISESMASGTAANYDASWACVSGTQVIASGTGTSGTFTTPATGGASVVCTFTNAPLVTSITVRKDMQDVNGANTAPRERWTVGAAVASGATQIGTVTTSTQQTAANGTASWTIRHTNAGTAARIAISEQQQAGFDFVQAYCDVTPLGGTPARTAITSAAGSTLTIAPGSTASCVFTNKVRPTTLTLVKQVTFGTAQTSLFTLTAAAPSGALAGPSGVSGAAAATSARITPAVAYRLSESGGPATYTQVGSWTCVNQAGATVAVSAAGDVTAAQGDDVTCTVRNATANLVILERIEGTTSLTASQFSLTSTPTTLAGLAATTVTGSESVASGSTIQVRPGHGYALTSTSTAAFIGLRFERYTGTVGANGSVDHSNAALWVAADPATVSVAAGQTGIYRFVATAPNPFVLPTTGGVGTAQIQLLGGGFAALALLTGLGLLLHRRRHAA